MDALNRCSIVIRIPAELQAEMAELQLQIRRRAGADLVRWTPSSELVLTLLSLGEIGVGQMAQIAATLPTVVSAHPAFKLQLEGLGGSPNNLQPRVLWVGVAGDVLGLAQLQQAIEHAVVPLVPHQEVRQFQAQVPIGRLKQESEANRSALGRAVRMAQIGGVGSLMVTSVELIRMAATTAGPTIVTVQSFALA